MAVHLDPGTRWWIVDPPGVTPEKPELSAQTKALENLLVSYFDGHDLALPTLPQAPEDVLRILREEDGDLAEASRVIEGDPVLSASVLRVVNSPFYRGAQEITAVRAGVTRLGTRTLGTLMMHVALQAATLNCKGAEPARARRLWERARAGAWIMRELARLTGEDEDEAFLIGLLHDIGNIVVLRVVAAERLSAKTLLAEEEFEHLCFECHQEFGELIAEAWKLPDRLKSLIRDHHTPPEPKEPLAKMRWMLTFSDHIAVLLGYAPGRRANLLDSPAVLALGLAARPDLAFWLDGLPALLHEALATL